MEETASIFSSQIASDMNGFISDYDALTKSLLVNEGDGSSGHRDSDITENRE